MQSFHHSLDVIELFFIIKLNTIQWFLVDKFNALGIFIVGQMVLRRVGYFKYWIYNNDDVQGVPLIVQLNTKSLEHPGFNGIFYHSFIRVVLLMLYKILLFT